jgi:NitT/TauT family transport system substrate-binding protein
MPILTLGVNMKNIVIAVLCLICAFLGFKIFSSTSEVTSQETTAQEAYSNVKIRLAKQYGMQYAPAYVAEKLGLVEKYIPGATVEWGSFGGGAAVTEALVSNHLDVGFMGLPPVVIAWDKGADMKVVSGISIQLNELMVKDPAINSLADFKPGHKIAVPGVGSTQHITLSIGAEKYMGDSRAIDEMIVTMANPDAFTSLISGNDLTAHFAAMPFNEREQKEGFRSILSGYDIFGDASILCVASAKFHDENPTAYAALVMALNEAVALINQRDPRVLDIIAEVEKISQEDVLTYLNWNGTNYTTNVYGLMGMSEFMQKAGYISNVPTVNDIMWESASGMVGMRMGERSPIEEVLY